MENSKKEKPNYWAVAGILMLFIYTLATLTIIDDQQQKIKTYQEVINGKDKTIAMQDSLIDTKCDEIDRLTLMLGVPQND